MTNAERFPKTHPPFQERIAQLAAQAEKTPLQVYEMWLKYCRDCETADQSPLLWEFEQWYATYLKPGTPCPT